MKDRRTTNFRTGDEAYKDALREHRLEERLNNLYDLADRFPEDTEIEEEIKELEKKLGY